MTFKTLRKSLAAEAEKAGICKEWRRKILTAPSREYLLQLFIKGLDFAILNDFPSDDLAAEFDDIAPAYGVYINRRCAWRADGKKRVIARDAIIAPATFEGFSVGEVYALHGSGVEVHAGGCAVVSVTVQEGARVIIRAADKARVKIFNRGGRIDARKKGEASIKIITP